MNTRDHEDFSPLSPWPELPSVGSSLGLTLVNGLSLQSNYSSSFSQLRVAQTLFLAS